MVAIRSQQRNPESVSTTRAFGVLNWEEKISGKGCYWPGDESYLRDERREEEGGEKS